MTMKRAYSPWSHEEDAALLRLRKEGKTNKQISIQIGRTHNAICSRFTQTHGVYINRSPLPPARERKSIELAQLAELYALGWRVESFMSRPGELVVICPSSATINEDLEGG